MCNRSMYKIFMFNRLCIVYIACQKHFYTNNFNWELFALLRYTVFEVIYVCIYCSVLLHIPDISIISISISISISFSTVVSACLTRQTRTSQP
jgi:hypothetical protein